MQYKYIVNENGNRVEVVIPYKEFQLLEHIFPLLSEDIMQDVNELKSVDLSEIFELSQKLKYKKLPDLQRFLDESRDDRF